VLGENVRYQEKRLPDVDRGQRRAGASDREKRVNYSRQFFSFFGPGSLCVHTLVYLEKFGACVVVMKVIILT